MLPEGRGRLGEVQGTGDGEYAMSAQRENGTKTACGSGSVRESTWCSGTPRFSREGWFGRANVAKRSKDEEERSGEVSTRTVAAAQITV